MNAEIKSFISPDIQDLFSYKPTNKESFSFLLELVIGIKGQEGGDLFSIEITTPKWLLENYNKGDVVFGRNRLIVFEYDINRFINEIETYINSAPGNTWTEIANQLSRIAQWEFEDYKTN